ncbi:MAG: hypothetical protein NDJ89_00250 [Oligoflexia bacterium]|nr:hypothetical protein [Oligoflexia bacterium]
MRKTTTALLGLLALTRALAARADESAEPTRGWRLGATYQSLLGAPFAGGASAGPGLSVSYEFKFKRTTSVDMAFSYRDYGGEPRLSQMGYGFGLRHALLSLASPAFTPFLSYGLLFQVSRLGGHSGSGTSHDTALGFGADFVVADVPLFAAAHYHYTRLRFFDTGPFNMDYAELALGWRREW